MKQQIKAAPMLYTVIILENETSTPETRLNVPSAHAHNLGMNGGYYKVQLINEFDQVDFEY